MELIIVILFFSVASVVCVQLFVNAYRTNISTKESSKATLITQNLAEAYFGCNGDLADLSSLYDPAVITLGESELELSFDDQWNPTSSEADKAYTATISVSSTGSEGSDGDAKKAPGGTMKGADISINSSLDGHVILTQHISQYEQFRLE